MAVKYILQPPEFAPGADVAKALKAGMYVAESDSFAVGDSLPVQLFSVPDDVFIYDLVINVETAFLDSGGSTGGATLLAGYTGDSDAFFNDTTKTAAGTHSMHGASGLKSGGYMSTGNVVVEASWATTCSVGGGKAYLIFRPYGDENYVSNP